MLMKLWLLFSKRYQLGKNDFFQSYRREMKGIELGFSLMNLKTKNFDSKNSKQISKLMEDEDVEIIKKVYICMF